MGTNFYLHGSICPECGRGDEPLHIGKSSAGWCFALHIIPEMGLVDLEPWDHKWREPGNVIKDEYGRVVTPDDMRHVIVGRAWENSQQDVPYGYASAKQFHEMNGSQDGPNGLVRHRIGPHCAGHGAGTWDLIAGEFS